MSELKTLVRNKKAFFDFSIIEKLEVGIVLKGSEVKSIRASKMSLAESFIKIDNGELFLCQCYVAPFEEQNSFVKLDTVRVRKLLAHKTQILKWLRKINIKGMTIIPLSVYLNRGRVKLSIGLAEAKQSHDKRHVLKERAIKRDLDRRGF